MKFTTEDRTLHDAAVRAGVRTFAQTTGATVATVGIAGQVVAWGDLGAQASAVAIAVGAAAVTGLLAGLAAYLSFIGKGEPPAAYVTASRDVVLAEQAPLTLDERQHAIDEAVQNTGRHAA